MAQQQFNIKAGAGITEHLLGFSGQNRNRIRLSHWGPD